MEIIKKLVIDGAQEVNAVLLNDEGEEYPVFLESLHNNIIFPTLIESGYSLNSMPYGFVKNGVDFEQLPTENYKVSPDQLELMYNSIGVKLPYDEIKKHLNQTVVQGRPIPPTNYTIHTRQELLEYLDATSVANCDTDVMPLNYFVAPEARFSLEEYIHIDNRKYVQLIDQRRDMSLKKFHNLIDWLLKINLKPNYTALDVIDAYFAWGMDGLDFTVISARRESKPFKLTPNKNISVPVVRRTQGFIDGLGNMFTDPEAHDVVWKLPSNDPEYISSITKDLQMNETAVVEFRSNATQEYTLLEGPVYNIRYNEELVLMQARTYTPIRVKSPADIGGYIDINLALPTAKDKLYTHSTLMALSRMLYDKRKSNIKVSSYDALRTCGANPKTALDYIITKYGLDKEKKDMTEDNDAPQITFSAMEAFLAGEPVSDSVGSFLQDCLSGQFNIDNIASGKMMENSVSVNSVFCSLYAVHHVMGLSLQDIYDKISKIKPEDNFIIFSNGEIQHKIDVTPMKFAVNGYIRDVQDYDLQNSQECTFFTYVTLVAREVGVPECRRHVGMEFYMVDKNKKAVKEILKELEDMYEQKVYTTIGDATKQAQLLRQKYMFSLSRFFEVGFKGTITWTKALGSAVQPATPSMIQLCQANMQTKIESLTTYCSFTTNSASSATLTFNAYCVNAYITPEYVIPRGNTPIKEVAFFAAWNDYASINPGIHSQLIANNVLPAGFIPWSVRYYEQQFVHRPLVELDRNDSLYYYNKFANEELSVFPADVVFHNIKHPIEYMFPGIYSDSDTEEALVPPRDGKPVVRIGVTRDITIEDYRDKLYPTECAENKEQYIKQFRGYEAEGMLLVKDIFDILPVENGVPVTVMARSETVYISDTKQVMDFRRLVELDPNKYPIVNIYGRHYLLRSSDGRLWEVRI